MATATSPQLPQQNTTASKWQDSLLATCTERQLRPPSFQIYSDRRGGRTAWSCTVLVNGQQIPARNWYSGEYVNNAKEDAAELALRHLGLQTVPQASGTSTPQGQRFSGTVGS